MEITAERAHEWLTETGTATEEEVALVTSINGWTIETLQDILYTRTGYRSFDQLDDFEDFEGE